ncbi:MAG: PaaI family thioesterase [Phycisphaerales bacterium]
MSPTEIVQRDRSKPRPPNDAERRAVEPADDSADPWPTDEPASEIVVPGGVVGGEVKPTSEPKLTGWSRCEAWLERLAHNNRFWRYILSRIWLPLAAHSGLTMKKLDPHTFTAVLPFRRFNRNFYNAMAGAALLANSEVAAGMYLFGQLKGKWTVVCKSLNYRFLRPCFGPAVYKVTANNDLAALMASGQEFNIDLSLEIVQQVKTPGGKERRVGRCEATFHCTPKTDEGNRRMRRRLLKRLKG